MTLPTLHYVYDPLCGWCYAAEPLVQAAADAGVPIILHGGGLWDPAVHATEAKRHSMRETDARISQMTGQPFGEAYLHGLLTDPDSIWWSRPTIAAVLAAEGVQAGLGLAMIAAIQRGHYVEGQRVVEDGVLAEAALGIRLDPARFSDALREASVDEHIDDTRRLMRRHRLNGYPSFLVEHDGALARVAHEACYGRPDSFVSMVLDASTRERRSADS